MLDQIDGRYALRPVAARSRSEGASRDIAAMIAHDMASSLGALRGYAAVLAVGDLDSAIAAHALESIRRELGLLDGLVAQLQATTVGNGPFAVRLELVAIDSLVADAAAFVAALPGHHPAIVTVETGASVWADPRRMAQVLRNLLSNAAKYSPPGAPIEVRARTKGSRAHMEVIDQGVGIPAEELEFIFGKYHRGSGQAAQVSGLGLGLYVVRRIVEAHGSELRVESTPDHGSIFSFDLEIAP